MFKSLYRLARFVLVGSLAAGIHWLVVVYFVDGNLLTPLAANGVGWLVALSFSFAGHSQWTFPDDGREKLTAALRFFAISAIAFFINQSVYAAMLSTKWLSYEFALVLVLVLVAIFTYFLSRYWAFASSR